MGYAVAMITTFGRWLEERGEKPYAYALRRNLGKKSVGLLAGISREPRTITRFNYTALVTIAKDSGIAIEVLTRDAIKAAAEPTAPRRYTRKEQGNGKEAAE